MNGRSGISVNPARSRVSLVGNPFHLPAIPNLIGEDREDRDGERNCCQHGSHVNVGIWTFFIFIFNLPVLPLFFCFALCEFIDYCKQYLTMYLTGLDRMGARLTRLTWGIYLSCYQVPFVR